MLFTCPNCDETPDATEIYTLIGITGSRTYVDCPECEHRIEVELLALSDKAEPIEA